MKKLLTITLVGAVLLLAACGGGGTGGSPDSGGAADENPDSGQSGDYISIEKSVFSRGETITVTTKEITEEMEDADAFVAIYDEGAEHHEYQQYLYPQAGSDTLQFTAPMTDGNYEMRLYKQDYVYTDETFVESVPFTVHTETAAGNTGGGAIGGVQGQLNGNTYSWICEDGINKVTYAFSGNNLYFSIAINGEIVLDGDFVYEIKDNKLIEAGGDGTDGSEFKLEGDKLTIYNFLLYENLILTKE